MQLQLRRAARARCRSLLGGRSPDLAAAGPQFSPEFLTRIVCRETSGRVWCGVGRPAHSWGSGRLVRGRETRAQLGFRAFGAGSGDPRTAGVPSCGAGAGLLTSPQMVPTAGQLS